MTVDNPIQHEVELVERLWSQGWAAFRTSASGPGVPANCDIVATKDGRMVALNLVVLPTGTSTEKVGEENDELLKIKRRSDPSGYANDWELTIGHAVKRTYDDSWSYAPINNHKVRATSDYKHLNEVVES